MRFKIKRIHLDLSVFLTALIIFYSGFPISAQEAEKISEEKSIISENTDNTDNTDSEGNPEEKISMSGEKEDKNVTVPELTTISVWDFIKMLIILAGVVGVIYALFFLLKKGAGNKLGNNDIIKLLDYKGLTGNRGLHLVEVGTGMFLLGSSENSISLISKIDDKESIDKLKIELSKVPSQSKKSFQDVLSGIFKNAGNKDIPVAETVSFMKKQRDRLKKLR